jgi:hypothetical protein
MLCVRALFLCCCCWLSAAWPTHGGSCFTADNGHVRRSLGTGGYALTLLQEEATEREGAAWLRLRLHDEQDAAPLRGFVVKALGGSGMIFPEAQLGAGQQNLDCGDGGAKEEAVTHTARRSKPTVTLEARVPLPETVVVAGSQSSSSSSSPPPPPPLRVTLSTIAMPEFSAWFKFRQELSVTRDGAGKLALALTPPAEATKEQDAEDEANDGLNSDSVVEL